MGERSPLATLLEKIATWGWVGLIIAGIVLGEVGYSSVHAQRPHIGGRAVTNLAQATAEAGQDALARGAAADIQNDPLTCYLSDPGTVFISCGPVLITSTVQEAWDNFRVTTQPSGAGVAVTPVDGVVMVGPLPAGTVLTSGNGDLSTVGTDQSAHAETMAPSYRKAAVSLLTLAVAWIAVSMALTRNRRHRDAAKASETEQAAARKDARRSWDDMAKLPQAAPVAPPWPVMMEHPSDPSRTPMAHVDLGTGEILDRGGVDASAAGSIAPPIPAGGSVEATAAPSARPPVAEREEPPGPAQVVWAGPAVLVLGVPAAVNLAVEPDRRVVVELAAYLACHPESPRTAEQIQAALWPLTGSKGDVSLDTVRQHLSRLRRCVGEVNLPDAARAGGYRFGEKVSSDWMRFQALAEAARRAEGTRSAGLRRDALALVRGAPFSGVPAGSYGWAWEELLVAQMEAAVADVAHRLAVEELGAGRPRLAEWATGRGLLVVPTDETLLGDRMAAARELSGRPGLDRAWRDARAVLGDQADSGPLADVYHRLTR